MPAGCSPAPAPDETEARLRKIVQAYDLATDPRGRPPRDASQLRRGFKELGFTGDGDAVLHSPRDGQPFVILFGATLDSSQRGTILAHEKHGADGKRYIVTVARAIKTLSDEEFAIAKFAKGRTPSAED